MTEDLLLKIRNESHQRTSRLEEYNAYAKLLNSMSKHEEYKKGLGIPSKPIIYIPEMVEEDIIMSTYEEHIEDIKSEDDTNAIYVYIGTFKYVPRTYSEIQAGEPLEVEVDRDDPTADFRCYANIEGRFSFQYDLEESAEFEKTHTVLSADNVYHVERDFITTAVKENQEKALNLVLSKYKK